MTFATGCVIWYCSPTPGPPSRERNSPLFIVPEETRRLADGRTRTEIWSIPESVICRAGHVATYALIGGWCEICSVRYAIRSVLPAPAREVGGEDVDAAAEPEPEPDSPVCVEARERSESCAERFDSTTVGAGRPTAGEDQPFMESRLPNVPTRPVLDVLLAPLILPVSDWHCSAFDGASIKVVMIGERSSGSYETGATSQCMRNFSPRTEL